MLDARSNMCYTILSANHAGVMELADVPDSKSGGSDTVRVRPPPPAPRQSPFARLRIVQWASPCLAVVLTAFTKAISHWVTA